MNQLRMWLIRKLAGKATVAVNLTIRNGGIDVPDGKAMLLHNVYVYGAKGCAVRFGP